MFLASMIRWSGLATIGLVSLAGLMGLSGCGLGDRPTGHDVPVVMKIGLGQNAPEAASVISSITLAVCFATSAGGTCPEESADILLGDTRSDDGTVQFELDLEPGDSATFTLRAYTATSGRLLYQGSEFVVVGTSSPQTQTITLQPVAMMLRASPLFQTGALDNPEAVSVDVYVHHVASLFGASFRIHYETSVLQFDSAGVGSFLAGPGPDTIWFALASSDFVAFSVTLHRDDPPADSGSGRLATFFFSRIATGTSVITINPSTYALKDPDGKPVAGSKDLILESGTVEVTP